MYPELYPLGTEELALRLQAVSKAELQVTDAQQRLMQLEQDKAELDTQLRQTQEAVLAGKQRVEKLREEVQRRTEARTVSSHDFKMFIIASHCIACMCICVELRMGCEAIFNSITTW